MVVITNYLTLTCLIVLFELSINQNPEAESHDMRCKDKHMCGSDMRCCQSRTGSQWCCDRSERCCSDESCCSKKPILMEIFQYEKGYTFKTKLKLNTDNSNSLKSIKTNYDSKRKYHSCDKSGNFFCLKKESCCKVGDSWECCPYSNGTCCLDSHYCCLSPTGCALPIKNKCKINRHVITPIENDIKSIRISKERNGQNMMCPDDKTECSDFYTCCLISNTSYGCCPYRDAVCCPDFIHCCPPDSMCNMETLACEPLKRYLRRSYIN